ncbi:MAG: hypothetical protein ABI954_01535 [Pyrinomonadaceae bacterium]
MKNNIKNHIANIFLFLGILCFVFGCSDAGDEANPSSQRSPDSAPASVSLKAVALVREFEENEVRATQLYTGKRVRINGFVNAVKAENNGSISLTFKTSISTYVPAQCYFSKADSNQLAQITGNQEVTVEGTVRGFSESKFSVALDNCSIP